MSFESPVPDWLILTIALLSLPVLLGMALLISRLLGVQSGCLPFVLFVAAGLLCLFGVAAYLNSGGQIALGEVIGKQEQLVYHLDGSWSRQIEAQLKYTPPDTSLAVTDTLSLLPGRFDDLRQGDFTPLRCSQSAGLFRFTRLEDQSTRAQLWARAANRPFFLILGLGLLLVLAARLILRARFPTVLFLIGFVTTGAWWMTSVAIPLWQEIALRVASLDTVTAQVREIHQPYLGNDLRAWVSAKLFSPCDLVLLDLIPLGRSEPLLAVDVVDRGSATVAPGTNITVRYLPSDPRIALVPDSSHSFLWKNGLMVTLLALMALAAAGAVAFLLRQQLNDTNGEA